MDSKQSPRAKRGEGTSVTRLEVIPDLSAAQFAAAKGVSVRTVRSWIAEGYVRATKVGPRLVRIPASELERISKPIEVA